MTVPHLPVLEDEVIQVLKLEPGQRFIDCTIGAGGHAKRIIQQIGQSGLMLGIDMDPTALDLARSRLTPFIRQIELVQANFDQLARIVAEKNFKPAQGILADLGVSSMQLDQPNRGFSFQQEGPLDMRMNPKASQSAADLINNLSEIELADIIYRYGEERNSRRIARAIVKARPLHTTVALADVIRQVTPGRKRQRIHPATRTFQALRIVVNDELGTLERLLPQAIDTLSENGRLAVISFHSLEDRIVKRFFQQESKDCICPPEQLICSCDHKVTVKIITKKPITASPQEISQNPRARSAKLRVAQRKETS